MLDLIIIGAGPAGLAVAIEAKKNNLNALVIEKGTIVNSIVNFPTDMNFFSSSNLLELDNIPFTSNNMRPSRRETVLYYQKVADYHRIDLKMYEEFFSLKQENSTFRILTKKVGSTVSPQTCEYNAKFLILATGVYNSPKLLHIEGEKLEQVSHYYKEPFAYYKREVVIVGGSNSAVEASLDIFRHGGKVTVIHRGSQLSKSVKYWILPDFQNRVNEGSIKLILNAQLKRIERNAVEYLLDGKLMQQSCDHVLLLTGYEVDEGIVKLCNIDYNKETLEPKFDPDTYESSQKGLYLAGTLLAGKFSNRVFIENSRAQAKPIIEHILSRMNSAG